MRFFAFCYLILAGPHLVALSDFYKSVLFHVGSSAFEISTKLAIIVAQWRAQLICNSAIYDNDDDDDDCLMIIMIVAPCCARYFRKERDLLSYKDLEAGRPQLMRTLSSALTSEIGSENRLVECYYYNYLYIIWLLSLLLLLSRIKLIIGFTCPPTIHFKFITKGDSLFYYKVRQPFYNKVRQVLLQGATCITKCDNFITKCDRTDGPLALLARFLLSNLPLAVP